MVKKVYITRRIPKEGIDILKERFEVSIREKETIPTREEIIGGLVGCSGLVCLLTDPIDKTVLSINGLEAVSTYAVGYNNIDIECATALGIPVTNAPGSLTDTTADLAFALMLSCARKVTQGERYAREGNFIGWAPMLLLGQDVHHKTLGIVGAGRIGSALARRAKGFEMDIIYHNRKPDIVLEEETGARFVSFNELLTQSDFISLHTPLTHETHHMFSENEFRKMKREAVFINTSRGPCVNEEHLVRALKAGEIWGAGLDVFENEPEIHPELFLLDNAVVVPHIGSASLETRRAMAVMAGENMKKMLNGEIPKDLINPEVHRKK